MRAFLENPRYTGSAFFGRWAKHETLLDPDDMAAGHTMWFRRSTPERILRSREPHTPPSCRWRRSPRYICCAGQKRPVACEPQDRTQRATTRAYLFRGRIRCAVCSRKMEASPRAHGMYYRCPARTLAPGSPALAGHPPAVYLREDPIREAVNDWIGRLFARENLDSTVAALVASQDLPGSPSGAREAATLRLCEAEVRLRRFQAAIEAGVDPAALVDVINEA